MYQYAKEKFEKFQSDKKLQCFENLFAENFKQG